MCLEQQRTLEWLCFPPVHRSAAPSASPSGGNRGAAWPGSDTRWSWAPSSPKWHPRLPAGSEGTKTQEECCRLSDGHSYTPALQRHYCCSAKVRIYPKLHNKDLSHSPVSKSALRPWTGRETHLPRLANHQQKTGDLLKLLMATLGSWNPQGWIQYFPLFPAKTHLADGLHVGIGSKSSILQIPLTFLMPVLPLQLQLCQCLGVAKLNRGNKGNTKSNHTRLLGQTHSHSW